MKKSLIYFAVFFAVLGIVFTILPMGTIALLPIVIALIFAFLSFKFSTSKRKKISGIVLIVVAALTLLVVVGKEIFIKDEVALDKQFEQKKIESQQEDIKDLEGL
jgi:EamA domain-containing membrane protein RarD